MTGSLLARREALRYTHDQALPSLRDRTVLQDREQGGHSAAARLSRQLFALNRAKSAQDMNAPGWDLHPLTRDLCGHWAIKVNGNWRLTFTFEDEDAVLVDYQDYQ
ncbi:MAG: type II toxin-antitoxin system RelE/ParE family toxin [Terracidiphilus sp.]